MPQQDSFPSQYKPLDFQVFPEIRQIIR
jgi:hypothetical protein